MGEKKKKKTYVLEKNETDGTNVKVNIIAYLSTRLLQPEWTI